MATNLRLLQWHTSIGCLRLASPRNSTHYCRCIYFALWTNTTVGEYVRTIVKQVYNTTACFGKKSLCDSIKNYQSYDCGFHPCGRVRTYSCETGVQHNTKWCTCVWVRGVYMHVIFFFISNFQYHRWHFSNFISILLAALLLFYRPKTLIPAH